MIARPIATDARKTDRRDRMTVKQTGTSAETKARREGMSASSVGGIL